MKLSTTRQLVNASIAADAGKGRAAWIVQNSYSSPHDLRPSQKMTYREAVALARTVREGCGWAMVERA